MDSVNILSREEIEEVAYQTAFLIQRGWRKELLCRIANYEKLDKEFHIDRAFPDLIWVKLGVTHEVYLESSFDHYLTKPVTIEAFTLEDAYRKENET